MAQKHIDDWPSIVFSRDEESPDERYVMLSVLSMHELGRRLEGLEPRVAASLNGLPAIDRPMVALEIKAGPKLPDLFSAPDGDDFQFVQRGLTWRPEDARLDGLADAWVLTQSLHAPRWTNAAGYAMPQLTPHHAVYLVVYLATGVVQGAPLRMNVVPHEETLEIPDSVIAWPPHPLVWWTPQARGEG